MRVHYLQHVSFEGLGYIGEWLTGKGASLTSTRFWESGWKLPVVEEIDALIVMGGPMGVYDEHEYPWLVAEKAFIERCLLAGKKVMGICLGAQLLSVCLGGAVHRAPNKEIGWFPVAPTEASKGVPWLHELFVARPVVFHWHGDQFGIPETGVDLLLSAANSNQAFYYNENVIGLQFHLEVTRETLRQMVEHGAEELVEGEYIQNAEKIGFGAGYIEGCNQIMKAILEKWMGSNL
ncbi:type 1 glutamine amidotransferase [Puia sp. P3]|uniref:type 1 glutamine amidotransferase n=1 Tax=Puia sp. P3 TaxID=3423952 RepID=UPI003D67AB1A